MTILRHKVRKTNISVYWKNCYPKDFIRLINYFIKTFENCPCVIFKTC